MKIKEIKYLLKENDIPISEFQKNLGTFLFRFDNNGNMIVQESDVRNTISRILNERKLISLT